MLESLIGEGVGALILAAIAGLACGFLNTAASSGSAVSLPILMLIGLDPITANATNRIPVLIGGISASASFHRRKVMPWGLALKVSAPVTLGAIGGALLAEWLPSRDLGLVITGAVLLALLLLFTKVKKILETATSDTIRFGTREILVFLGIGVWLGFIVLDGATYMLLVLVLLVGAALVPANAIKSAVLVPTSLVALAIFIWKGHIDWEFGAAMALGSIAGGLLGAQLATSVNARKWIFRLLVFVILAELVHLAIHYLGETL
ncbi:MAG: sulfite exporter TauE/SafE family protein [Dongiaceae bacterium]